MEGLSEVVLGQVIALFSRHREYSWQRRDIERILKRDERDLEGA
jgi:hypothetical protein